jgi:dolichol-phosphate mannosyltransferase
MRKLTVVIPTYNEAENLEAIAKELWALPIPELHILVVDDASPDGTGQIADELAAGRPGRLSVIHRKGKLGLGSAYITGFKTALEAGAEAIAQMDADFSHDPDYLPEFMNKLESADAVLGSRYIPGGSLDEHWGIGRVLLSAFGNLYARIILGLQIKDVTGGYRLWRRETLQGMPLDRIRSNGYVFQVEMSYVAQKLGYRLIESPIYFEDRRIGQSKMTLRIQLEAAYRVWQVRYLHRHLSAEQATSENRFL